MGRASGSALPPSWQRMDQQDYHRTLAPSARPVVPPKPTPSPIISHPSGTSYSPTTEFQHPRPVRGSRQSFSPRPMPPPSLYGRPFTTADLDTTDVAPHDRSSRRSSTRGTSRYTALNFPSPHGISVIPFLLFSHWVFFRRAHRTLASGGSYATYGFPLAMVLLSPPTGRDSLLSLTRFPIIIKFGRHIWGREKGWHFYFVSVHRTPRRRKKTQKPSKKWGRFSLSSW